VDAVVVRRSEPDDFDAWFQLFQEVAAEGRWIGREGRLDRTERRRAFERTLGGDDGCTFVAELADELVGLLGVTVAFGLAELGMMVGERHRGRGVGSALMGSCVQWCRERRAHKLTLTVWPHNERAIALYRAFGFQVEGRLVRHHRRRNGELWDILSMGLVLDTTSAGSGLDDAPNASG
jgi:RimJ/RimL family protein N-acetyltransferase